jgi:hypothetical protein
MLPLGGGVRLPVDVLEFTGLAGRYLQLALVSRGWHSLYTQLRPDHRRTAVAAAVTTVPLLAWARDNGLPWDERTAGRIATGGHLEVLQQARADGCPWDKQVCNTAAIHGHLELLQWAHANGCPWSEQTCTYAVGGHIRGACRRAALGTHCWVPGRRRRVQIRCSIWIAGVFAVRARARLPLE